MGLCNGAWSSANGLVPLTMVMTMVSCAKGCEHTQPPLPGSAHHVETTGRLIVAAEVDQLLAGVSDGIDLGRHFF